MKILKTSKVVLAFVVTMVGGFPTAFGALPDEPDGGYIPSPISMIQMRSVDTLELRPQPGYDVTLLTSLPVHFEWWEESATNDFVIKDNNGKPVFDVSSGNESKNFVIKDSKGKSVFEKSIDNESSIDILLSNLNKLKAGQKYSWSVNGKNSYNFTILDAQTEKELLEKLDKIDAEGLSPEECALKKANYLLMLSEEYSNSFDFYWLIAQLMSQISPTDKNLKEQKSDMLTRCSQHLNSNMN